MDFQTKQLILLTGAGYTRNFGGFLGREMWAKIFNNPSIQNNSKIRSMLLSDFDFESIYSNIHKSNEFNATDKTAIDDAVEQAYRDLDSMIVQWRTRADNLLDSGAFFGKFLGLFTGHGKERGMFFTLNQDLFMERYYSYLSPGVKPFPQTVSQNNPIFPREEFVALPLDGPKGFEEDIHGKTGFIYIKLHGSYGWLSSDGKSRMVIGKNKLEDILNEPLLNFYLQTFSDVVQQGKKKLLIIGYGFQDDHINEILIKGISSFGLKIYIINPQDPETFKENLKEIHSLDVLQVKYKTELWTGIAGYFPYDLRVIFPPPVSSTKTSFQEEIERSLKLD